MQMQRYTVTFTFLDSPQSDVQSYFEIEAKSEDEAILIAKTLLQRDFPRDAESRYSVRAQA